MGGVDLLKESLNAYRCNIRIRKWHWKIITWMVDLSCANARHLFKQRNRSTPYLAFRRSVVPSCLSENVHLHKRPRLQKSDHVVIHLESGKRMRCKVCGSQTVFLCNSCEVAIHPKCFAQYHS